MNKNYFSHDLNARSDPKLMKIAMKNGMEGLGIYWCIIEMLYEQDGKIPLINIESIAFALHTDSERITDVLRNYELFRFEEDYFTSDSVLKRIDLIVEKSEKTRQSAIDGWQKRRGVDANAKRTQSKSNAIKVNKSKGNEKKEKNIFIAPSLSEVELYFDINGYTKEAANRAYNFYLSGDWHDSKGNKVKNWKQKMQSVWFRSDYEKRKPRLMMP